MSIGLQVANFEPGGCSNEDTLCSIMKSTRQRSEASCRCGQLGGWRKCDEFAILLLRPLHTNSHLAAIRFFRSSARFRDILSRFGPRNQFLEAGFSATASATRLAAVGTCFKSFNRTSRKMLASAIAAPFKEELVQGSTGIRNALGRPPKLRGILANADEPSRLYAQSTKKSCEEVNIQFELVTVGDVSQKAQATDVEQAVLEANMDDNVDGIMVYFPIFGQSCTITPARPAHHHCPQAHKKMNTSNKSFLQLKTSKAFTFSPASISITTSDGSNPNPSPPARRRL